MKFIGRLTLAGTFALVSFSVLYAQTPDLATTISRLEYREVGPALMGGRIADLARRSALAGEPEDEMPNKPGF
mgnify:CR=1 FL=1